MTLGELIERLEKSDPNRVVPLGFSQPESWRGIYADLSFRPARNITVGEMLAAAKSALGATFTGYKGGAYTMSEWTDVHIDEHGESRDLALSLLLDYMLGESDQQETR